MVDRRGGWEVGYCYGILEEEEMLLMSVMVFII